MNSYKRRYVGRYGKDIRLPIVLPTGGAHFAYVHTSITHMLVGVMGEPKLVATDRRETW